MLSTPAESSVLRGRRVLVTAGPTLGDLDPVRFIGNRSSGRMGFAIAAEAARRGAQVTLVAGPATIEPPRVAELVRVRSAVEMHQCGARPRRSVGRRRHGRSRRRLRTGASGRRQKVHKDGDTMTARSEAHARHPRRARSHAVSPAGGGPLLARSFAAETERVEEQGAAKRQRKHVDLIVANDVARSDAGFDASRPMP